MQGRVSTPGLNQEMNERCLAGHIKTKELYHYI
jgi:hypothetical protein